ncbi:MAG: hypothetical protein F4X56_03975 [Gammaproteobacteria bacterium]|nr:hypothetical protein [Gammaproteobacteria bacterium]
MERKTLLYGASRANRRVGAIGSIDKKPMATEIGLVERRSGGLVNTEYSIPTLASRVAVAAKGLLSNQDKHRAGTNLYLWIN